MKRHGKFAEVHALNANELLARATQDYGSLISDTRIWPPGMGVDVILIGGTVVQYHPDGQRYAVDQPSDLDKLHRRIAQLRGRLRQLLRH